MQETHEREPKDGLTPSTPEDTIQWTDTRPTMPGWYWLRRAILPPQRARLA